MNLLEIRKKFRDLSGRYDLVNGDDTDNGADFYINSGSRWLDRSVTINKSYAIFLDEIPKGTWYSSFPLARAVKDVWLSSRDGRRKLIKEHYPLMIQDYYLKRPSEGYPTKYSSFISRTIPNNISPEDILKFQSYVGIINLEHKDYNAILFSSPLHQDMLIEVCGIFYSSPLENDQSENFWSLVHPEILIRAAIRSSAATSGNVPMLKILDENLKEDLLHIDMDLVEEGISEIDQMEH